MRFFSHEIPFYQVDAFAEKPMAGGPAAVMPVEAFPDADQMLAIAAENNLAETAFLVARAEGLWDLRWFTPAIEVPLCGHATLAAAHVIFDHLNFGGGEVGFDTKSGRLTVTRLEDGRLEMDFPVKPAVRAIAPAGLAEALGAVPAEVWSGHYLMAVFGTADEVRVLKPDFAKILALGEEAGNIICAAPGNQGRAEQGNGEAVYDVVSRFFAPAFGIPEDPATGSAHCMIAPVFSDRLGKTELNCFQAYPGRGAHITTRLRGDRVKLIGRARTVVEGVFRI